MRVDHVIAAAFFCLLGAVFAGGAIMLGFGKITQPGPGFFPLLAGSLLVILAVSILWKEVRQSAAYPRSGALTEPAEKRHHNDVAITLAGIMGFLLVLPPLGFALALFCLIFFMVAWVGRRPLIVALIYAFSSALIVYIVFQRWLMIQLPLGITEPFLR